MRPEELETKAELNETNRDGSSQVERHETTDRRQENGERKRIMRPRIHVQRSYGSVTDNESGENSRSEYAGNSYRPRFNNNGGYQQRQQGGYRPRFNADNNHSEGDSEQTYRPRYNNNNNGSYQQRQQGGFRPRYNNNNYGGNSNGGYQQRQQGGYRPRYNNDSENANDGEKSFRPRYNNNNYGGNNGGGYQQRQQGGFRPRYNNNNGGGYQQRGGYNNRGGYQQGGYRQRSADYDPNAKYSLKKRIEYKETHIDPNEPLRLNKFIANAGVCSRREADEYIQTGAVTVNGQVVTELGVKVLRTDEIVVNGKPITIEKKVYVLLNKPKGYVTTSEDPQQRKTVMDLVKDVCPERIYPVGRLDRNTTGVLLLTNDGDLASKLTHPKFLKKKVYHVFLDKNVTAHDIQQIADGVELSDGEIHADSIAYASDTDKSQVGIEIHSGKNRIVRRIFESLGYRVVKLDRVQFAGLTKKNLRRGDWRFLTEKEVDMLRMGAFE